MDEFSLYSEPPSPTAVQALECIRTAQGREAFGVAEVALMPKMMLRHNRLPKKLDEPRVFMSLLRELNYDKAATFTVRGSPYEVWVRYPYDMDDEGERKVYAKDVLADARAQWRVARAKSAPPKFPVGKGRRLGRAGLRCTDIMLSENVVALEFGTRNEAREFREALHRFVAEWADQFDGPTHDVGDQSFNEGS